MAEPPKSVKLETERGEDIGEDEPKTDPKMFINGEKLEKKLAREREALRTAKLTGLAWGASLIVVSIGLAFGGFFTLEARSQNAAEKAHEQAVKDADAGADKKLAPIERDVAVIKTKVDALTEDVAEMKKTSKERDEEILRLLRKRER